MLREQYTNNNQTAEFSEFQGNPDFGAFYSENMVIIPANGNILIEDIPGLPDLSTAYQELSLCSKRELTVFKAEELSAKLVKQLDQIPKTTGFIFPGNGSRIIQDIMQQCYPDVLRGRLGLEVKTKRSSQNGSWTVSVEIPDLDEAQLQCTEWVIVDDVVLSGQTATTVKQEMERRTGRESDSWALATWLSLDPKRRKKMTKTKSPSSVEGFNTVSTLVTYKGPNGIPPCNSLSTLLQRDAKGFAVRQKLADSYFNDGFDQFLQKLSYGTQ